MDLIVKTTWHATLAVLGLSPESQHQCCDWCSKKAPDGQAYGRWWFHESCREKAGQFMLRSLLHAAVEWVFNEASPAPACDLKNKPRPAALTEEQLAKALALRVWGHNQDTIAERLGVNRRAYPGLYARPRKRASGRHGSGVSNSASNGSAKGETQHEHTQIQHACTHPRSLSGRSRTRRRLPWGSASPGHGTRRTPARCRLRSTSWSSAISGWSWSSPGGTSGPDVMSWT